MENVSNRVFKDVVCLVGSVVSIMFCTIWYISLALSICSLIYSIKSIRTRGNVLAKVTTVFSIIGLVACVFIYASMFMIFTLAWFGM